CSVWLSSSRACGQQYGRPPRRLAPTPRLAPPRPARRPEVPRRAVPPWALAVAAMLSVQLGSALSVRLIESVGPAGTAWLRLSIGALIFLALARPPLRAVRRADAAALLGLGVTTGLVTAVFLA